MPKFVDLIRQKFGKLTVIKRVSNNEHGRAMWLCRCECNCRKTIIVRNSDLKNGNTKSCGCLQKEKITKHGHYGTATYRSWDSMIQRCTNPKRKQYKNYGGRNITVCKRWLNSFKNFLEDMGECPESLQVDRIDNNKDYCKENCQWATPQQQQRNRRNNRLETYNEKTQCIAAWVKEYNIPYSTLWNRLYKYNWPIKKALTTPVRKQKKRRNKK